MPIRTRRGFFKGVAATGLSTGLVAGSVVGCARGRSATEIPVVTHALDDVDGAAALLWPDDGTEGRQAAQTPTQRALLLELVQGIAGALAQGGDPPAPLRALAHEAAMTLETWRLRETTLWVLREAEGQRRGAGAHLFRTGATPNGRPLVIQSPHVFHDQGTGPLGLGLMTSASGLRPWALCVNTQHRYRPWPGPEIERNSPSDACHTTDHPLNTVLAGLVQAEPELEVVQLHGFRDREIDRLVGDGREPLLAVVSAGSHPWSETRASQIAAALRGAWGSGARLFPDQTRLLGAMTNTQGRMMAAYPEARFIHIELAASVRARPEAEVVATLAQALTRPPRASQPSRPSRPSTEEDA